MLSRIIIILFFSFSLILSGCSDKPITVEDITGIGDDIAEVFGKDDSENYGKSKSIASLEIPPSLDDPNYSDSLKVPKVIDARGEIIDMSDAPVLPTYLDMNIIKQGIARWLEIQADPSSLWPYLNKFWISQGYEIKVNDPVNGILETEWKKNKINFESDGDLIESNEYNYNASKEKFRVRAERQPNGDTNIYISNHILEADNVDDRGKIIWKKKDSDVSREAEMLVRLMEYFGISRDVAIDSFNKSEKDNKGIFIDLIDFYGVPAIIIEESFSKLWREIGLALDRSGLLVIDQNRNKAVYIINTDQINNKETDYEIKLTKSEGKFIVTAHNLHRSKISYKDARRILKHIISAYGSNVVKR
mgnify:CR=1 FL=1